MKLDERIEKSTTHIFKAVTGVFTFVALDENKKPIKIQH